MKLGITAGADRPLGRRLVYITALRLVVLGLCLLVTHLFFLPSGASLDGFSSLVALGSVGAAFALSAGYAVLLRSGKSLHVAAYAQLVTDQLAWTALVYISGGATSGFTSLYGLTCLSGAILTGTAGAAVAAASAIAAYVLMCVGFSSGVLPVPLDQSPDAYVTAGPDMVYPAFSAVMAILVVTSLGAYLAERLRTFGVRLDEATQRAERAERMAALGRLAAGLAHEIRNPLSSIQGSIELLRMGGTLNEEDRRLCEIVERETARLNDLVGDMVDLSRPREPALQPIDLAATASGVVHLAQRSHRGADVAVVYAGPDQLEVIADPGQMRQVLWNLVRNAVQASSAGGTVTVELGRDDDGAVVMQVCDEGTGIPESRREHIFDAFFTTRSHGVGIGLAVVKQVADAHGFDLEVQSEAGAGSVFRVRIPSRSVGSAAASVAASLLVLLAACSPANDWLDANPAPSLGGGDDEGWHLEAPADEPAAPPSPSAAPRRPAAAPVTASPDDPTPVALTLEGVGGGAGGAAPGSFRNTYYDFPAETELPGDGTTRQLFDAACTPIETVSAAFHDQLCVQGSGRLKTGHTVSFAKRDCPCAAVCPRTDQKICFDRLDRHAFPFGRGAMGTAITPLRTVAVDTTVIPLGTVLYIPAFHGLRDGAGTTHDGCFVAQDRGLRVKGRHVDVFTGSPATTRSWNSAVPSNQGVQVIVGASRCAHLKRP